tara:strand:- start:213 stop:494 length:282 start_codon:yes stop_codon:yes gene_type:complete
MPFEKGNQLSKGRPAGSLNKVTSTNRNFLQNLLYNHEEFKSDWEQLDINERMSLRIKLAPFVLPRAVEEEIQQTPVNVPFKQLLNAITFKDAV